MSRRCAHAARHAALPGRTVRRILVLGVAGLLAATVAQVAAASPAPARVRHVAVRAAQRRVINFATPVALGNWPGDGSAPAAYPGVLSYPDGTANKYYPSKVLSVHGGVLDWWCHDDMAASVVPFGYGGFTYGTYTVRMRTQHFSGYHIAFLLWPASNSWTDEVDGPENETSARRPYPAVLQSTSPVSFAPHHTVYAPRNWNAAFHNYTWVWSRRAIRFYQDTTLVARVTTHVPHERMRPTLQVEFSSTLASGAAPNPALSGHVYVDRVSYTSNIAPPGQ